MRLCAHQQGPIIRNRTESQSVELESSPTEWGGGGGCNTLRREFGGAKVSGERQRQGARQAVIGLSRLRMEFCKYTQRDIINLHLSVTTQETSPGF